MPSPRNQKKDEIDASNSNQLTSRQWLDILSQIAFDKSWNTQGVGLFNTKKIPTGIKAIREIILDTTLNADDQLKKIQKIAQSRLKNKDSNRTHHVDTFYDAITKKNLAAIPKIILFTKNKTLSNNIEGLLKQSERSKKPK